MPRAKRRARTLCYLQFKQKIVQQARVYWFVAAASKFSDRWWRQKLAIEGKKRTISSYTDVLGSPFSFIDLSPEIFLATETEATQITLSNAIVALATALEVYLTDVSRRAVYINPALLEKGDHKFGSADISAAISGGDSLRAWFANQMAEKITRSKSDREMIESVMKLIKRTLTPAECLLRDIWVPWSYVRNAVVHAGGLITSDLADIWGARFPRAAEPLRLQSGDLMACQANADAVASAIDGHFAQAVVGAEDGKLLVRELFVRYGIDDRSKLAQIVAEQLRAQTGAGEVQKALDYQKKYGLQPDHEGIIFSDQFLASLI